MVYGVCTFIHGFLFLFFPSFLFPFFEYSPPAFSFFLRLPARSGALSLAGRPSAVFFQGRYPPARRRHRGNSLLCFQSVPFLPSLSTRALLLLLVWPCDVPPVTWTSLFNLTRRRGALLAKRAPMTYSQLWRKNAAAHSGLAFFLL